jgi:hypothetical protein
MIVLESGGRALRMEDNRVERGMENQFGGPMTG